MAKKTIQDLLADAKLLKEKQKALKAEMQKQKQVIATEYRDCLSDSDKEKQLEEAKTILETAKTDVAKLKAEFKLSMVDIREKVAFAKEILAFVNYKNDASLNKRKQEFLLTDNSLTLKREGINDITIDVNNPNWQKNFKAKLALQGINGVDRVADNIVYKASCLVKSNVSA